MTAAGETVSSADVVIVTGSRRWTNREALWVELDRLNPTTVVHGGARGADHLAHGWAEVRGRRAVVYFPDYQRFGRRAPLRRNIAMIEDHPDATVAAFPLADSRGTWHTVTHATKRGRPITVTRGRS